MSWVLINIALLMIVLNLSYSQVYLDKQEGLLAVNHTIREYQSVAAIVLANTEEDAIIVSKKSDKVIFPARNVIYDLFYEVDYWRLQNLLISEHDVYLWDFVYSNDDIVYLNATTFMQYGYHLEPQNKNYNKMGLYKYELNELN